MKSLSFPGTSNLNGEEVLDGRKNRHDSPAEQEESFDYTSSSEELKNVTFQNLWTKEEVILSSRKNVFSRMKLAYF